MPLKQCYDGKTPAIDFMRILVVIPYLAPSFGGPTKVVQELCANLGLIGVRVDVVTTHADASGKLAVTLNQWIEAGGYRLRYFKCWNRNDLVVSISLVSWLIKNVKHYDVIHTHNRFAPLALTAELICQLQKKPFVVTPHGMLETWALSYKAQKKQWYYNLFERPSLQKAKAIHVLTESEAKQLQSLGFLQTAVVPNGIDPAEYSEIDDPALFYEQFPATQHKDIILFLGRIDPKKGLDLLATAFATIHQQFPNTHLVIAGPDSIGFWATVEGALAAAGCLKAVTLTGMITGPLKKAALAAAQIFVAPSYSEGFSMSVLEGMVSGLPCILTTGCNFPEAAAAGVAYVIPIDAKAIAQTLQTCLQHPQQAQSMGVNARRFILEHYTWNHAAQRMKQVYEQIVANEFI